MASRKPIVIVNGQLQQLQAGDSLDATATEVERIIQTSGEAGGIVPGMVVYSSAADTVKKAQANAAGTMEALGFSSSAFTGLGTGTVQTSGVLALTTAEWDAACEAADSQAGGLTFNTVYYLGQTTAGKYTKTAPTTVGQIVLRVGKAISTTEMLIGVGEPIVL